LTDLDDIRAAEYHLFELMDGKTDQKIIVDFSEVEMLSSAMLSVLLSTRRRLVTSSGRLAICGVNETLRKLFRVTNLHELIESFDDVDSAAQAMTTEG
jgi:stage II sporulation protein AA (anti-sigma F factor antagonist)